MTKLFINCSGTRRKEDCVLLLTMRMKQWDIFVFTSKFGTINLSKSRTMVTKGGVRTKVQTMVRQGGGGPAEGGHTGARPDLGPRQTTC